MYFALMYFLGQMLPMNSADNKCQPQIVPSCDWYTDLAC